jgi:hypothetical protein
MPQGLQLFNESGGVTLDTNHWVGQQLGSFTLPDNHGAGSLVNGNLSLGRPFVIVLPTQGNRGTQSSGNQVANMVTVSGSTLSWNAATDGCLVVYGIF